MRAMTLTILISMTLNVPLSHAVQLKFQGPNGNQVTKDSIERFISALEKLSAKGERDIQVVLESGGGDLQAAYRGYTKMKELGVDTHAKGECASSCTMLYAAGKRRSAAANAKFMFHAVNLKLASGLSKKKREETKKKIEAYRLEFSRRWLETIREADPSLAWELERDSVLLSGKDRYYGQDSLRRTGFVND